MKKEVKIEIKFKEFVVLQVNSITDELLFMQDFDTAPEAESRAMELTHGLLVGIVANFLFLGSEEITETVDSQANEVIWKEQQRGARRNVIIPGSGLKV